MSFSAKELRYEVDMAATSAKRTSVKLPIFARTAPAAARIASQVFGWGRTVIAVRQAGEVVWSPIGHVNAAV